MKEHELEKVCLFIPLFSGMTKVHLEWKTPLDP